MKELKRYLSTAPIILAPEEDEDLFLYLAVSDVPVSSVLLREEEGRHKTVFYTSKMLLDAEMRYNTMEKMVLALVTTKKKLRRYFVSHNCGHDQLPIGQILSKPDFLGRLTKWAI